MGVELNGETVGITVCAGGGVGAGSMMGAEPSCAPFVTKDHGTPKLLYALS